MDAESGEFQDWEVLDSSVDSGIFNSVDSVDNMQGLKGIGDDSSEGIIRFDYFSLHNNHNNYLSKTVTDVATDEGSVDSDKPYSLDPLSDTHGKDSDELPSDGSGDCKFSGFDCKNEYGIVENDEPQLVRDVIGEIVAESENSGEFLSESSGIEPISSEIGVLGDAIQLANPAEELENSGEETIEGEGKLSNEDESVGIEAAITGRRMVWWKLPLNLLRYCAIRVSPVWTVSVTAAVLGIVILGRQLHKMKKKSRSLQLKVTVDDKKVSQAMSKAARLNEAFSIVKRVPVIRSSLPASGVTPWPVMNMR